MEATRGWMALPQRNSCWWFFYFMYNLGMTKQSELTQETFNEAVKEFCKQSDRFVSLFDFGFANGGTKPDIKTYMSKHKKDYHVIMLNTFLQDNWYKNTKAPLAAGKYFENELSIDSALPEFELGDTMFNFQQAVDHKFTINQGEDTDIDEEASEYLDELDNIDKWE